MKRRYRNLATLLLAVAFVALVASACADGDDVSDGQATTGTAVTSDGSGTSSGDGDGDSSDDDGPADDDTAPDDTAPGDTAPGDANTARPFPGACSVDEVNSRPFYAVTNIPEDDPDGGLNIRNDWDDGDVVATLPEGSVVFVLDCHRRDDGGIWFAVETGEVGGWANSAFLTTEIPSSVPTFGGPEAAAKVETVLDALAAGQWAAAATELVPPEADHISVAALLDDGDDVAAQLEAYCATRICDAPYIVTEIRGSYILDRYRAEVDVEFEYPGGSSVQTFHRVALDGDVTLGSLPGRSVLAWRSAPAPVSELVEDPAAADADLYEAAEEIRQALLSETGARIPPGYIPAEGVAVSTDAYVDPVAANRVMVTESELAAGGTEVRIWGYTDGVGTAIVDSVDGHFSGYRRDLALLDPDTVAVDRRVGLGNTIANLGEVFPDARVVEFHRRGRGQLSDFNWSSVRLALEERDGGWKLVAITSDSWTI